MSALIGPALDIAQTAADLSGVPYLSTAIGLVQSIKGNCDKIQIHKVSQAMHRNFDGGLMATVEPCMRLQSDCRILADKSGLLIQTFADQASHLHESQLREHADAVEGFVQDLRERGSAS